MRTIATLVSIVFVFFSAQFKASAATFIVDDRILITMTGEIIAGDAERLATIFTSVKPYMASYYLYPSLLYLNSPGGDVSEAIRIAELIKTLGITVTTVPNGKVPNGKGVCASSCFLIYVAALQRSASGIDTLRTEGRKGNLSPLGVHRPYLRTPADGQVSARLQEQAMSEMRAYLVKSSVGHTLIDKMMAHASNDIYWLNAEEIRELGSYSPGVEEQLIFACGYNSKRESNLSARDWIESSRSGVLACIRDYERKTYRPLLNAAIDRMRTGWRPWQ